ncbi:MAG: immunoglobulin domain-containing protein [Acidobacteriaceae bacterium]
MPWFRCVRTLALLSAALTLQLTVAGCGAGWGDNKPVVSAPAGQAASGAQTVTAGQSATFSVNPSGTGPFTFQWYKNGVAISGATGSSYTTPPATGSDNGAVYTCSVTNAAGTVTSQPFTLTVNTPPAITAQPQSLAVTAGQPATFTVVSGGTAPLSYQWYQSGTLISGATSATLIIPATSVAQSGSVYTVTVTNSIGATTSTVATLTVNPEASNLAFNAVASVTYGTAPFPVSTTSASNGTIAYSVVSGPARISGNTVTLTGTGTVVLEASQGASGNYAAATVETSFTVSPGNPNLAFTPVGNKVYGSTPFPVSATSASNGAITYSVVSGPATISSNTVTVTGTGPVVLEASQAATSDYTAATTTTTFSVGGETPTLTFAAIPAETYGNAPFPVSATSASPGAVTYSVVSGPATVSGNTVTLTGTGTVVLQASQAASGNYVAATQTTSFTVSPATPTLTFAPIPPETYGNAPFQVSATSASGGVVTYSVLSGPATIVGNTVTLTGVGTPAGTPVVLEASQAATANYTAATARATFTVSPEVPTLTFAAIPAETYGNPPFQVSATSASSGAVTYSVLSGPATIVGNTVTLTGVGTPAGTPVVLQASQAASGNYTAATATTSFTVAGEVPTLTFAMIPAETYGNPPFQVSATSASGGAVTYSVLSGPATVVGNTVTLTGPGTVVLQASQASSGNYAAATVTTSFSVYPVVTISAITPANQTSAPKTQNFSATASGGSTNQLTWSASGGTITSAGVWTAPDTPGAYTITATSVDNPTVSVSTTAIISAPVITAQPVSRNACAGYPVSLSVAANYASSYQWTEGGSVVGTGSALTFSPAATSNSGTYQCTAINAAGNATCNPVVLNIASPTTLAISQQPASVTVYATQTATFSVSATGTGGLSYQWYQGTPGSGTLIAGATSSSYTTGSLTTANSGTTYYATVTDSNCTGTTLTSAAGTLTVSGTDTAVPPTIVVQPLGQTASVGGQATFSVTAAGPGTLTYQWYRVPYTATGMASTAGTAISGANSSTYTVPSSDTAQSNDGDNYYVVVTNGKGTALSNRVVLAVGAGIVMQITDQPQTVYVPATSVASFNVNANCTGCTPAYQWYWYAPGASTATAFADGAVSSGVFNGATVIGSATSSVTLENVPAAASGSVLYAVVTSTSNGARIPGTNSLTSNTAGLFVGSLGTVGNTTAGDGLCNSAGVNWVLNGSENNGGTQHTGGTTSGDVPYQNTSACTIELTNDQGGEQAAVYWPTLISTANFTASFTVQVSDTTNSPADGFTMILADPSQGATTASLGTVGEGLAARGIPGLVVGFDTYQNGNAAGGNPASCGGCDPITVPYMAVGPGANNLWENPWYFVNGNLDTQSSTDYPIGTYTNSTHTYVISVVNGVMTVTMDGYELFTGTVNLPPVAYLGFTASTGGSQEAVTFSNMNVKVSAP